MKITLYIFTIILGLLSCNSNHFESSKSISMDSTNFPFKTFTSVSFITLDTSLNDKIAKGEFKLVNISNSGICGNGFIDSNNQYITSKIKVIELNEIQIKELLGFIEIQDTIESYVDCCNHSLNSFVFFNKMQPILSLNIIFPCMTAVVIPQTKNRVKFDIYKIENFLKRNKIDYWYSVKEKEIKFMPPIEKIHQ